MIAAGFSYGCSSITFQSKTRPFNTVHPIFNGFAREH
jgi:hypothetical protein